jgi:hypothetical protein
MAWISGSGRALLAAGALGGVVATAVLAPRVDVAEAQAKQCTSAVPGKGKIRPGQVVTIPNHCRCKGGTLHITGGDGFSKYTGKRNPKRKLAPRTYRCA